MSQALQNAYKEDEGWVVPEGAPDGISRRIDARELPEGATWHEGEDDGKCRLIKPDGTRCRANRIRGRGLCPGHAGVGGVARDPAGMSLVGIEVRKRTRERRLLLGLGPRRGATPRGIARLRALEEAEGVAAALLDPVYDPALSSLQRQQAAVAVLDAVEPLAQVSASVQLPGTPEAAEALGWGEMRALAAQLGSSSDVASPSQTRMDTAIEA